MVNSSRSLTTSPFIVAEFSINIFESGLYITVGLAPVEPKILEALPLVTCIPATHKGYTVAG